MVGSDLGRRVRERFQVCKCMHELRQISRGSRTVFKKHHFVPHRTRVGRLPFAPPMVDIPKFGYTLQELARRPLDHQAVGDLIQRELKSEQRNHINSHKQLMITNLITKQRTKYHLN